jgi:hypothetical protein
MFTLIGLVYCPLRCFFCHLPVSVNCCVTHQIMMMNVSGSDLYVSGIRFTCLHALRFFIHTAGIFAVVFLNDKAITARLVVASLVYPLLGTFLPQPTPTSFIRYHIHSLPSSSSPFSMRGVARLRIVVADCTVHVVSFKCWL